MSLIKLLKSPLQIFKKDVIAFVVIHRYDLGVIDDKLCYLTVKATASISVLRQKIWHLLELPDYCEELIILKTHERVEIPLTEIRKGNDPQRPYLLEVWPPGKNQRSLTSLNNNMLTMGDNMTVSALTSSESIAEENNVPKYPDLAPLKLNENNTINKQRLNCSVANTRRNFNHFVPTDLKKSDLSCKMSTTSLFFKLKGKKSVDSFTNILLKIQNDLTNLSVKLNTLESKIAV